MKKNSDDPLMTLTLNDSQTATLGALAALIAISGGHYVGFCDMVKATGRDRLELGRDLRRLQAVGLVDVNAIAGYTLYPAAVAELGKFSNSQASRFVRDHAASQRCV